MKICKDCFADEILKNEVNIAERQASCDICSNNNVCVYDTQCDDYLIPICSYFCF